MRSLIIVVSLALALLGACKKKDKPKDSPATTPAAQQASLPTPVADAEPAAKKIAEAPPPKMLRLTVKSKPAGADLTVDGKSVGVTPANFELIDDKREHEFILTKEGYVTYKFPAAPVRDGLLAHIELKPLRTADAGP